jgi:hypothetical protein
MVAINCCKSAGIGDRLGARDFQRHHNRNPFRCQRISVYAITTVSSCRHSRKRDNATSVMRVA